MGKFLRVNMSTLKVTSEEVPEKYALLGGRGLTSTLVADEVDPTCHPLGPSNKIVFAPGIVTGTAAPSSGRISVGGKSPLTFGIKEANAGTPFSQKLARLGVKALIVEGQPADPKKRYLLELSAGGARLVEAPELAGKGLEETFAKLAAKYPKQAYAGVGPAGEAGLTTAGVCFNDLENRNSRYSGRGGLGAVLGRKGLKAIVVDDSGGPGVPLKDQAVFTDGARKDRKSVV